MLLHCAQEVLLRRLGPTAYAVNLKLNPPVPTSVRLLPAKEYRGASIGISYDLRIYAGQSALLYLRLSSLELRQIVLEFFLLGLSPLQQAKTGCNINTVQLKTKRTGIGAVKHENKEDVPLFDIQCQRRENKTEPKKKKARYATSKIMELNAKINNQ